MKQAPYSWDDASYLTRKALGVPPDAWMNIGMYNCISLNLSFRLEKSITALTEAGGMIGCLLRHN